MAKSTHETLKALHPDTDVLHVEAGDHGNDKEYYMALGDHSDNDIYYNAKGTKVSKDYVLSDEQKLNNVLNKRDEALRREAVYKGGLIGSTATFGTGALMSHYMFQDAVKHATDQKIAQVKQASAEEEAAKYKKALREADSYNNVKHVNTWKGAKKTADTKAKVHAQTAAKHAANAARSTKHVVS